MRVIFMGTPEFSVPALRAVAAAHEVACVYTQPPRAAGRGQKARLSPVHAAADGDGADGAPSGVAEERRGAVRVCSASGGCGGGGGLRADPAACRCWTAPRLGCLNIHASILPRWRGAAPIHRAIMAGDAETGVAIMQMEAGLDTGPVLAEAGRPSAPKR